MKMGLARPPPFDGTQAAWRDFRFRLRGVTSLLELEQYMVEAERVVGPMTLAMMPKDVQARSRFLWTLLLSVCTGRALKILRLAEPANGFEAWMALVQEYEPNVPLRRTAMLASLLTPD